MFERDLLKGRNIIITGGGTGLGRSMALRFAELGANLFLSRVAKSHSRRPRMTSAPKA
jgi:NAD(P)-dependent dehydrogenase (short-subunit alcohol dehydrogenase family)